MQPCSYAPCPFCLCIGEYLLAPAVPAGIAKDLMPLMHLFDSCAVLSPMPVGAWSSQLRQWLPQLPEVSGLKVHSIVLADPQQQTTADALFLAYRWAVERCSCQCCSSPVLVSRLARCSGREMLPWPACLHACWPPRFMVADPCNAPLVKCTAALYCRGSDGKSLEPEVYPRPNGTTYICGVADEDAPVPPTAADVHPRPEAIAALRGVAASVSQELGAAELLQEQACYLPTTEDGLPLIGRVPGLENAYVATGVSTASLMVC